MVGPGGYVMKISFTQVAARKGGRRSLVGLAADTGIPRGSYYHANVNVNVHVNVNFNVNNSPGVPRHGHHCTLLQQVGQYQLERVI